MYTASRTTDSHLKRIRSTKCCIHMVVPPDHGPRCDRNIQRLSWMDNRQSSKKNNKYQMLYTYGCTS
jgi:hypothetical protein